MIGAVARRLQEGARARRPTIKEESVPYEQDPINHVPPVTDEDQNFTRTPSLRFRMRQRVPNPKREL